MKAYKKILFAVLIFGALLLAGCGRSDLTLTVNEDGSFKAVVNYGIIKAGVANDEALEQAKAMITDSLDQANIPYSETEDKEKVTITVERDFADLAQLTSAQAWQGIGFVPAFSADGSEGIWARYEDGRLKLSGTLDVNSFGAADIVSGSDAFGGSVTVVLPSEAEDFSGGEKTDAGYVWSGGVQDTVELSLTTAPIFSDLPQAQAEDGSAGDRAPAENKAKTGLPWIGVAVGVIAAAVVIFIIIKKNGAGKAKAPENESEPKDGGIKEE